MVIASSSPLLALHDSMMPTDVGGGGERTSKNITPSWLVTASKGPPATRAVLHVGNLEGHVSWQPAGLVRRRTARLRSRRLTRRAAPSGPTSAAAGKVAAPAPYPTSSGRCPGCGAGGWSRYEVIAPDGGSHLRIRWA